MGDRTWAHITVLKEHAEEAARTLDIRPNERIPGMFCSAINTGGPVHIEEKLPYPVCYPAEIFELEEVNYGGEYESEQLSEACIPHDIYHGSGDEYEEGYLHARFDENGEVCIWSYAESQTRTVSSFAIERALLGPLAPGGLEKRIRQILDNQLSLITPSPWTGQLENAAKAKVRAVIAK